MAQKVVLKVMTMTDDKTKQKAIEAAADLYGVDSIAADLKEQKPTVIGQMDSVAVAKKLKKVSKIEIMSVGPAKEEKKEEKKEEPKEEKKVEEKKVVHFPAIAVLLDNENLVENLVENQGSRSR